MSISPQLRQLFSELLMRESKFFKSPDKTYDLDGLLASATDSFEQEHPQMFSAFARESVRATAWRLMNEKFRKMPRRFKKRDGNAIQGTLFIYLPDEDGVFSLKETKDALVKELERKYDYHDALIRGNTITRDHIGELLAEARAQNLAEDEAIGTILEDIASGD
jgi:hypothetical protein